MVSCSESLVNCDFWGCRLAIGVGRLAIGVAEDKTEVCNLIMYSFCQIKSKQKGQIARGR